MHPASLLAAVQDAPSDAQLEGQAPACPQTCKLSMSLHEAVNTASLLSNSWLEYEQVLVCSSTYRHAIWPGL